MSNAEEGKKIKNRTISIKSDRLLDSYLKDYPQKDAAYDSLKTVYGEWGQIKSDEKRQQLRKAYAQIRKDYPSTASVVDVVDHIEYVIKAIGIDHVGIGTDFDGGGGVPGINDATEFSNITLELVKRGYTENDIRKIWGGNAMRVLKKVTEISKQIVG